MVRNRQELLIISLFLLLLAVYFLSQPAITATLVEDYCRDVGAVIDGADSYVKVALFLMRYDGTDRCPSSLVKKLAEARRRGLEVEVFMADENYNKPALDFLREANVSVFVVKDPLLHAKVLETEKCFVVGSHNWTWNATHKNLEASVIVCGSRIIDGFFRELEQSYSKRLTIDSTFR